MAILKTDVFLTLVCLVLFSAGGACLGSLFGEAYEREPLWMISIPAVSALGFGLASQPRNAFGHFLNRLMGILSRPYQASGWPVRSFPALMAALAGGAICGIYVAFEVLDGLVLDTDYATPVRLSVGGLSGAATFVFRRVLLARWGAVLSTARGWSARDAFIDSTPR